MSDQVILRKVRIEVTQEDIDTSRTRRREFPDDYNVCRECAVARALHRTFGRGVSWAFTGGHYLRSSDRPFDAANDIQVVQGDRALLHERIVVFDMENRSDYMEDEYLVPFSFKVEVYHD